MVKNTSLLVAPQPMHLPWIALYHNKTTTGRIKHPITFGLDRLHDHYKDGKGQGRNGGKPTRRSDRRVSFTQQNYDQQDGAQSRRYDIFVPP